MPAPPAGIHLVHKPAGATSFSLVQALMAEVRDAGVRRNRLRVCHGGALDPFADGLLPLLVGTATRLFELLHPIPKQYVAEVAWGTETDNGDPLGRTVATGDASRLEPGALDAALARFIGWHEQVPPATSNKRVGGERAYARAHRGEEVVLPAVRAYLHEARWLAHDLPGTSRLLIVVRGGYYVRSLARDLGRALGCRAHLSALRRMAIGPWRDPGPGRSEIIRGAALLPWCRSRVLADDEQGALGAGRSISRGQLAPPDWALPAGFPDPQAPVRALRGGTLVALLREQGDRLEPVAELGGI